jgi:aminopeptidase N
MKQLLVIFLFQLCGPTSWGQFSHADSLRGGNGNGRNWWDLKHYDLSVTFDIEQKQLLGKNIVSFSHHSNGGALAVNHEIQIDLQEPMILDSVLIGDAVLKKSSIRKDGNAYFIPFHENKNNENKLSTITIFFHGSPKVAKMPPWDGGIIWSKDPNGKPWVSIACQGLGASVWYPCKDTQMDEPDSVTMHFTVPTGLKCISNGQFLSKTENKRGYSTFSWHVSNPINNYNIIPYIGDYTNIHEHYTGEKGNLELDYWVLKNNEEKAKIHFAEVPRMLTALEHWFGPYPFYSDGYKLVEAPHLGMEHQSAIAYGNGYQNGYQGTDLSKTGEGLKWDFIIVHESGHEWFGNNITSKDVADMWIHEGFTNYSEVLFMDYWFGTEAANTYCIGLRKNIKNDKPIIGQYGVQDEGSGDMYYKGSNMLHTIRALVGNDSLFRQMLREMNQVFYHQTITTAQIEEFMSNKLNMDLSKLFNQYLRQQSPPTLQIKQKKGKLKYRWVLVVDDFDMPLIVQGKKMSCTTKWSNWQHNMHPNQIDSRLYFLLK